MGADLPNSLVLGKIHSNILVKKINLSANVLHSTTFIRCQIIYYFHVYSSGSG